MHTHTHTHTHTHASAAEDENKRGYEAELTHDFNYPTIPNGQSELRECTWDTSYDCFRQVLWIPGMSDGCCVDWGPFHQAVTCGKGSIVIVVWVV